MHEEELVTCLNFGRDDCGMDCLNLKYTEAEVDLESGGATSKEVLRRDASPPISQKKKNLKRALGGVLRFEGSSNGKFGVDSRSSSFSHGKGVEESLNGNNKENIPFLDGMFPQQKCPLTNSRKHPKPPRPPKGPLIDVADQKLIKDTAEFAMRKRLRIERMKALKKAKTAHLSKSSSTSSIGAMIITVLFFLIIIFQGISSRNDRRLHGSLKSDVTTSENLISVHYSDNLSLDQRRTSASKSSNSPCVGRGCVSGSASIEAAGRAAE
ncbi:hypothetical protein SAY86_009450 [Trapa natans]|uniref:Transmembrane protein n=1 Tax=Trapa natans TaxID=22666 RepID=A0AAN7QT16_TRANT|nr:hypothetical protein SAY86_009450 [Trapa natans]